MYSASKITIISLALGLVLAIGCTRMPIPTSAPPGAATPSGSNTIQPAPSLTAVTSLTAATSPAASPSVQAATPPAGATTSASTGKGDPANGAKLFAQQPCSSCHDVTKPFPGGVVAPNLGNIATEADRIVHSPDYHGKAQDAAGYIHESIVDPNAYVVPGDVFHSEDGQSIMPKNFGTSLTPEQIDDLVAYLLTLK